MAASGRPLIFIATLCSGWILVRVAISSWDFTPVAPAITAELASQNSVMVGSAKLRSVRFFVSGQSVSAPLLKLEQNNARMSAHSYALPNITPAQLSVWPAQQWTDQVAGKTAADPAQTVMANAPKRRKFVNVYLYSFWRQRGNGNGLAAAGQYGASQSGLIATLDAAALSKRFDNSGLALLFRATTASARPFNREAALGLRWKPVENWPVTLSVEQRFRQHGADRPAAYVSGGVDQITLPAHFTFDAYGQAGAVAGRDAGPFYDLAAHAKREILNIGPLKIGAGAGIWAGGQTGLGRLDTGPSIRAEIPFAGTHFRLDADWRFRVAGNAAPASGPAITLSTAF